MWRKWPFPFIARFVVGSALVARLDLARLTILPVTLKEQVESVLCLCLDGDVLLWRSWSSFCSPFTSFQKFTFGTSVSIKRGEKKNPTVTKYVYEQGNSSLAW